MDAEEMHAEVVSLARRIGESPLASGTEAARRDLLDLQDWSEDLARRVPDLLSALGRDRGARERLGFRH